MTEKSEFIPANSKCYYCGGPMLKDDCELLQGCQDAACPGHRIIAGSIYDSEPESKR